MQFPNRYQLVPVAGTDDVFDLLPAPGSVYKEGTLINKGTLLKDATAALYGLDVSAVPDDALASVPLNINTGWKLLTEYTAAGTYTWTAPDLFGGKSYYIGVLVIGAGGGGGAVPYSNGYSAVGGASGYSVYRIFRISPGDSFNLVVGSGGLGAALSSNVVNTTQNNGENGNSSSFHGVVADGGAGGIGNSATAYGLFSLGAQCSCYGDAPYGGELACVTGDRINSATVALRYVVGDILSCWNPFECSRILGAGGLATILSNTLQAFPGGKNPITGLGGGDGVISTSSASGNNATESGCGGGGCMSAAPATGGAGADGAVKIYVLGGVT